MKECIILVFSFISYGLYTQDIGDTLLTGLMEEVLLSDIRSKGSMPWSYQKDTTTVIDIYQNNVRLLFDRQSGVQSFNGENFAQDIRISIRGYGSRSAFGIRGIRLYQDGIPLTSPDGTTQMDEISIFDISELDVVRSGMAARLGNAGGGALSLRSTTFLDGINLNTRINSLGSYDIGIKYGAKGGNFENLLSVNHHRFEGRREFSAARNTTLYNKIRFHIGNKWQLDFIQGAYSSPEGKDPGALSLSEFGLNKYQANGRNFQFNAGESVRGILAAAKSLYQQSDKSTWISSGFYRLRDFTGRLPFLIGGWVDLDRHFAGINNVYEYRHSNNLVLTIGQSTEYQTDRRTLAKNNNGIKETTTSDQNENVLNLALYQQLQMRVSKWNIHQMLRYDHNQFTLDDIFLQDGAQNGEKLFKNFNGSLGLGYEIKPNANIFFNLNSSFETPTLNELTNNPEMTGGFNKSLASERSVQFESGIRWTKGDNLDFSASVYQIRVRNQIVGYELASTPGRTYYRNAAVTNRNGLELSSRWRPSFNFNIGINYNWSYFSFKEYKTSVFDFTGNLQPLIPTHKFNISISAGIDQTVNTQLNIAYNSKMFLDDANDTSSDSFFEISASIYTGNKFSKYFTVGVTGHNLFNLMDYSNFRSNAAALRYYEAASPMHTGLFIKYIFIKK